MFDLNDGDRKTYSKVLEAFEKPQVLSRLFSSLRQSNESVDRNIFFSINCGFGELRDSLIKDRLLIGIADKTMNDRLLREDPLTRIKSVKMYKYQNA